MLMQKHYKYVVLYSVRLINATLLSNSPNHAFAIIVEAEKSRLTTKMWKRHASMHTH